MFYTFILPYIDILPRQLKYVCILFQLMFILFQRTNQNYFLLKRITLVSNRVDLNDF